MAITLDDLAPSIPSPSSESAISNALDNLASNSAIGTISTAISDTFRGLNHRQTPTSIPINRDYHGLTFFTRPWMNMTTQNLRQVRQFTPMLSSNDLTIPRAIRAMLDVDCERNHPGNPTHGSRLINNSQAFIAILSNQLTGISGWPDLVLETYDSRPGQYKEAFSMGDGVVEYYGLYDIRATFRSIPGDPITALFLYWIFYISKVYRGELVPYPDALIENEIDYMTRIYRLVLDPSRRFVQKIAACGAAFPIDTPIGNAFNFESESGPINRANDSITVGFRCIGAMYQDDILIDEFNRTVVRQNNLMNGTDSDREDNGLFKLGYQYLALFNHMGYPRINPDTYELEWWVERTTYDNMVAAYLDATGQ
jgi:hypothetical protein